MRPRPLLIYGKRGPWELCCMAPAASIRAPRLANSQFGPRPPVRLLRPLCTQALSQQFLERLPIMGFPARRQVLRRALREAGMVKDDLGSSPLLDELEPGNREDTRIPATRTPGLDDSHSGNEFDVPPGDIPPEAHERASLLAAHLRGLDGSRRQHAGLQDATELNDFLKLLRFRKRFVHTLAGRLENWFLVNGFRRMRNFFFGRRPGLGRAERQAGECHRRSGDCLPPSGPIGQSYQIRSVAHYLPPGFFPSNTPDKTIGLKYVQDNIFLGWWPPSEHTSAAGSHLGGHFRQGTASAVPKCAQHSGVLTPGVEMTAVRPILDMEFANVEATCPTLQVIEP